MSEGSYNVTATVTDAAGNSTSDRTTTGDLIVDTTPATPTPDTVPPTLVSTNPAHNSTDVALNSSFVFTFDEPVVAGAGNITILDAATNTAIATINVNNPERINFDRNTVTVDPAFDLSPGRDYYVNIDPGAIQDLANNPYEGITDSTTLNFSTAKNLVFTTLTQLPINFNVLDDNFSPADDLVEISQVTQGENGTVIIDNNDTPNNNSDDLLVYTPNPGFTGTDSFTYTVTDSQGNTFTETISVVVKALAIDDSISTLPGEPVEIDVLANDNQNLTITAVTNGQNGTVVIDNNNTPNESSDDRLVYTPNEGFIGEDSFTYTVTDSEGNTETSTVKVNVDRDRPLAADDFASATLGESASIDILNNDKDPNSGTLTITSISQPARGEVTIDDNGTPNDKSDDRVVYTPDEFVLDNGISQTPANGGIFQITGDNPSFIDTFSYTVTDAQGITSTANINVTVEPSLNLKFTLTQNQAGFVNEVGVFRVEDENGTINGLTPGDEGYLEAALSSGKVIFSSLSEITRFFGKNPTRILDDFNPSEYLGFFLVQNSTVDRILAGETGNVFFATNAANEGGLEHLTVDNLTSGQFSLSWEDQNGLGDSDFNDLKLTVEVTNESAPVGNDLQGQQFLELLDLTEVDDQQIPAQMFIQGNAGFNNFIGFYQVVDATGAVKDPITGEIIAPGEAGYADAALAQQVVQKSQNESYSQITLSGGNIYAPLILSDNQQAFFPFIDANSDGVDHIRLLSDNTFGFEDVVGGGDFDYNDVVVEIELGAEALTPEILDFNSITTSSVEIEFSFTSDSDFNNVGGFYEIANSEGAVVDPVTGNLINPGESGYSEAALAQSVVEFDQNTTELTQVLPSDSLYAPYILSNGEEAFFPFIEANSDGIDHIRTIADNTFGFEDLPGGGDVDYNDVILKLEINNA